MILAVSDKYLNDMTEQCEQRCEEIIAEFRAIPWYRFPNKDAYSNRIRAEWQKCERAQSYYYQPKNHKAEKQTV